MATLRPWIGKQHVDVIGNLGWQGAKGFVPFSADNGGIAHLKSLDLAIRALNPFGLAFDSKKISIRV